MSDALSIYGTVTTSSSSTKATSTSAPINVPQCQSHAWFFSHLRQHDVQLVILVLLLPIFIVVMVQVTRTQVPKPPAPEIPPKTHDAENAADTTTQCVGGEAGTVPASSENEAETGGAPPPYHASTSDASASIPQIIENANEAAAAALTATSTALEEATPKPKPKTSSAHKFVVGTSSLFAVSCAFVLFWLDIQALLYCHSGLPSFIDELLLYVLFSLIVLFALIGVGAWMLLFRNLFGRRIKEKWVFNEYVLLLWIVVALAMPFACCGIGGLKVGEKAVKTCQGWCCADALEEEEEEEEISNVEGRQEEEGGHEMRDMVVPSEPADDEPRQGGRRSVSVEEVIFRRSESIGSDERRTSDERRNSETAVWGDERAGLIAGDEK